MLAKMFNINYNSIRKCERRYVTLAKVGRHKIETPKDKMIGVRLTAQDYELLKMRATEHNLSLTQSVIESIKLLYKEWGYKD